jgi:hypothetical protein
LCQYFPPIYPVGSLGTPPALMIIPKMINPIQVIILIMASTNSTVAGNFSLRQDELRGAKERKTYPLRSLELQKSG